VFLFVYFINCLLKRASQQILSGRLKATKVKNIWQKEFIGFLNTWLWATHTVGAQISVSIA